MRQGKLFSADKSCIKRFHKKHCGVKKKYLTPLLFCYKIAKVIGMDEILAQTLLYDFYGELLTEHQKNIYEQFVLEDLSLREIAESEGISRQGVHDLIRRCSKTLEGYEEKLHLVEKFLYIREKIDAIDSLAAELLQEDSNPKLEAVRKYAGEILEEL